VRGDKRIQVRALENALRLNPKDVDSAILLAETFQTLGMHARATRLWEVVRHLRPNHPVFAPAVGKGRKGERPGWRAVVRPGGHRQGCDPKNVKEG